MSEEKAAKYLRLAELLAVVPAVQASGPTKGAEGPEWKLAHALSDIEKACGEYPPALEALLAAETQSEVADALVEIVEVLRHVAYHLADPPYLRPLLEERLAEVRIR